MKVAFITLLIVGIIYASVNDLRLVKERIRFLENRVNSDSKFRHEDYSEIIFRLDEIDKVLNTSLDSRARVSRYDELPKETGETSSKAFEHLKEDFTRLRKAFGEEKAKMARSRREIPILGNNVKAVQEEIDNYCKIGLNKTDKVISRLETNTLMISKVSAKQIAVYDKLENVNQLKKDFYRIRKAFGEEKTETARIRREIPSLGNNLKAVQEEMDNYCKIGLNKTDKVMSKIETNALMISEVSGKQQTKIALKLEQVKRKTDDIENKTAIINERVDTIVANVEINKVNIERVYSLVTEVSTNLKTLFRQMSCIDLLNNGITQSGTYKLRNGLMVYCDQTTDGGGWIVFQRRIHGEVDFYRNWAEYKNGFGDLNGEFWLGNKYLSLLTADGDHELRIELEDFDGNSVYAKYSKFKINPEEDNYKMEVSGYSGTAGDSLDNHNGKMFTTIDRDNDESSTNCAVQFHGAWWYTACFHSNLNGQYSERSTKGIKWHQWKYSSLKEVEMKFR